MEGEINKGRVEGCCRVEEGEELQVFLVLFFFLCVCVGVVFVRPCMSQGGVLGHSSVRQSLQCV